MNIAIEEDVEDALVAFLVSKLPGDVQVRPAYLRDPVKYPCVIVAEQSNDNTPPGQDTYPVTAIRTLKGQFQLLTELKDTVDGAGNVKITPREQCKTLRRAITVILADSNIVADLNAASALVEFSTLFLGEIPRGLGGNELESTINFEAIACGKDQG